MPVDKIAKRLGISRHTAVSHGRSIYERLGVHRRPELVGLLLDNPFAARAARN
jgi:DNA-binding CsgD family transcriptional regulator